MGLFGKKPPNAQFKGKAQLNIGQDSGRMFECPECGNKVQLTGDPTHLTCNCEDCPCYDEQPNPGPPPNCGWNYKWYLYSIDGGAVYSLVDSDIIDASGGGTGTPVALGNLSITGFTYEIWIYWEVTSSPIGKLTNNAFNVAVVSGSPFTGNTDNSPQDLLTGAPEQLVGVISLGTTLGAHELNAKVETNCGDFDNNFSFTNI